MTHGSLFSGIGGIDLGFEWAGIETKWQVEIDPYCRELLSKRFPNAKQFEDVKTVGKHNLEKVDIVSGGFPCQDISIAGKGKGLEGERSGLWTELHRVISELRPRFAFIENVPMLTIRGGVRVIADLAEIGYDAEWQIVGADDVGAWHRRKRIWIVAYPKCERTKRSEKDRSLFKNRGDEILTDRLQTSKTTYVGGNSNSKRETKDVSNTGHTESQRRDETSERQQSRRRGNARSKPSPLYSDVSDTGSERLLSTKTSRNNGKKGQKSINEQFARQNPSGGKRRLSSYWAVEPNVGRVAHGIPKRVDRLKGLGNAVVPHIPYIIGKRLKELCQKNQAEKPS